MKHLLIKCLGGICFLQKDDGKLYAAVTNYDLAQGIEAIIYSGYTPGDFTAHYVNLGIQKLSGTSNKSPKKVWAPEFFEDTDGQHTCSPLQMM